MSRASRARYVFSDFVLSPSRRLLLRGGREVPLIPRYFDLLVLLVERRGQAVHRREIFDAVWRDVVVSDGALSQAVRTLRRALGDDPREPMFIRTVSRHGYSFVFPELAEEPDEEPAALEAAEAGVPAAPEAAAGAFTLRRDALRAALARWGGAIAGGAGAGLVSGILGGLLLRFGPGSQAADPVPLVLGLVGLAVGGVGAAGVGAGIVAAETLARSFRAGVLALSGALGGGAVGAGAHLLALWTIQGLFGRDLSPVAGGFEGFFIGGAAGLGYALATRRFADALPSPEGSDRIRAVLATGACCAAAAVALAATGSYLGAMSLDFMAHAFPGSQVGLAPLSRLLGESEPGLATRLVISGGEGLMFGSGLAWGLTRRPFPDR